MRHGQKMTPGAYRGMSLTVLAISAVVGCLSSEDRATRQPFAQPDDSVTSLSTEKEGGGNTMQLTSTAFADGQPIPRKYTGDGEDTSPPLSWTGAPENTQELVLICDDPDAPSAQPWVHWVLYKIPPTVNALPEDLAKAATLQEPAGCLQGKNSWSSGQTIGYRGPAPPPGHGTHHYHFQIYALDAPLNLGSGTDKSTLLQAMSGHVLAQGELIGTYER